MYNYWGFMTVVVISYLFWIETLQIASDYYYYHYHYHYHYHCHFHYDDDDDCCCCCCCCYHFSKANLLWVITIPLSCYQSPAARMWAVAPFSPWSVTTIHSLRPLAAKRDTLSATTPLENDNKNTMKHLINPSSKLSLLFIASFGISVRVNN